MADLYAEFEDAPAAPGKRPVNNPGALRPVGASTGFMQFPNAQAGQDALHNDLIAKGKRGVNTVEKLIGIWAPPSENNTTAYIAAVAKEMGVDPKAAVDLNDPVIRGKIATAIQRHEGVVPLTGQKPTTAKPDFSEFSDAPIIGGGRGVVNPTAEDIAAQVAATPNAQQKIFAQPRRRGTMPRGGYYAGNPNDPNSTATLGDVGSAVLKGTSDIAYNPATESFARGITAGGYDYGKAALMPTTTSTLTFKDKLADVRARRAEQERQFPISSGLGNVAGAVTLGALTGGTSLPGQMATTGVIGGVNKFTESKDTTIDDAMKAGLINAGAAGVFGLAGKGFDKFGRPLLKSYTTNKLLDKTRNALEEAGVDVTKMSDEQILTKGVKILETIGPKIMGKGVAKEITGQVTSAIIPGTIGALGGAGAAALAGQDPWMGAKFGAAGTIGAVKLKALGELGDVASLYAAKSLVKNPKLAANAARAANAAIPGVNSATKSVKDAYHDPYSEFEDAVD